MHSAISWHLTRLGFWIRRGICKEYWLKLQIHPTPTVSNSKEKESLITELRKELRLSNEEHGELLGKVNADDVIRRIREWRQAGGIHSGMLRTGQATNNSLPSPSVLASHKKQKINRKWKQLLLMVMGLRQTISYMAVRVIGQGSFGVVFQEKCLETGEAVAIKRVFQDKRYKNRELQTMRVLR